MIKEDRDQKIERGIRESIQRAGLFRVWTGQPQWRACEMDADENDLDDDEEDDDFYDECGAVFEAGNSQQAYYYCSLAGTEHCDFRCAFARDVRRKMMRRLFLRKGEA